MASLSPVKPGMGEIPVIKQPEAKANAAPGGVVRVNFSQAWGASLKGTHADFKPGSQVDIKVTCLGTHQIPLVGSDTKKTIPLSGMQQDAFTGRFDLNLPEESVKSGFSFQGHKKTADGSTSSWGEALTFKPAGLDEAYAGRPLSSITVQIGRDAEGKVVLTQTQTVDRTARERLDDCWGSTRECFGGAYSAVSARASATWTAVTASRVDGDGETKGWGITSWSSLDTSGDNGKKRRLITSIY